MPATLPRATTAVPLGARIERCRLSGPLLLRLTAARGRAQDCEVPLPPPSRPRCSLKMQAALESHESTVLSGRHAGLCRPGWRGVMFGSPRREVGDQAPWPHPPRTTDPPHPAARRRGAGPAPRAASREVVAGTVGGARSSLTPPPGPQGAAPFSPGTRHRPSPLASRTSGDPSFRPGSRAWDSPTRRSPEAQWDTDTSEPRLPSGESEGWDENDL